MAKEILDIAIRYVVPLILGYCLNVIKSYKKKRTEKDDRIFKEIELIKKKLESLDKEDLKQMKSDISNKFYVYNTMTEIEDYLVESFRNECERYFDRGGDSWVHPMYNKSLEWNIKPTEYLK